MTYRRSSALRGLHTAAVAALAVACASSRAARAGPQPCAAFAGPRTLDAQAIAALAGDYSLTLVATSGERSGQIARGTAMLFENPDRLRRLIGAGGNPMLGVVVPFYGTADIDVTEVGALPLGTTTSDDPLQPGVLVIQNSPDDTTVRSLVMRLGSETNRRNAVPFDGGYTVLRVRLVGPDSILGSWASGTVTEVAAGFFCAVRRSNEHRDGEEVPILERP